MRFLRVVLHIGRDDMYKRTSIASVNFPKVRARIQVCKGYEGARQFSTQVLRSMRNISMTD